MAVPDFQTLMLPVLQEFADGTEHLFKDVRGQIAEKLGLTSDDSASWCGAAE